MSGAEREGPCTHISPEKPGILSTQDRPSNEKDGKPFLSSTKLRTGNDYSLVIYYLLSEAISSSYNQDQRWLVI